mgnify:CR=1 FL=1
MLMRAPLSFVSEKQKSRQGSVSPSCPKSSSANLSQRKRGRCIEMPGDELQFFRNNILSALKSVSQKMILGQSSLEIQESMAVRSSTSAPHKPQTLYNGPDGTFKFILKKK